MRHCAVWHAMRKICMCAESEEVFCLHPSCRVHVRFPTKNRLTGEEICTVIWTFQKSVFIRLVLVIHTNLVVFANDVFLFIAAPSSLLVNHCCTLLHCIFQSFRELMSHPCSSVFPSQYTFILYRSRCLRSRNMQFQSPSMFLLSVSVGEIIPPLCNFCSFGQHLRFSNLPRLVLARTSNTCLIRSKFVFSSRSSAPRLCRCRLVILHERL